MNKCKVFAIVLLTTTIISCNKKTEMTNNMDNEIIQKVDYVMNDNLSLSDYSDFEGYIPKEGFISSPEIAAQIAEIVWTARYPKGNIEDEKPFSINLEDDIWIIEGHWDKTNGRHGGVAYMEIRKSNGEILKVIHGK